MTSKNVTVGYDPFVTVTVGYDPFVTTPLSR